MKTIEAIKEYNHAELIINKINPKISAFERASKINQFLKDMYDEEKADEIIDLVFAHEFYPVGLNKNE
jgi:hypothetical protein